MKDKIRNTAGLGLGIAGLEFGLMALAFVVVGNKSIVILIIGIFGITFSSIAWSLARQAHANVSLILVALVVSLLGATLVLIQLTDWKPFKESVEQQKNAKEKATDRPENYSKDDVLDTLPPDTASWEDILETYENESENTP